MRALRRLTVGALALLLVVACSGEEAAPPPVTKATPKAAKSAKTKQTAEVEIKEEYRYDPEGKPDPFRSFLKRLKKASAGEAATPLQRFDLSQLTVTGVIWNTDNRRALVKAPGGKAYIVSEGTPIGKNDGRVTRISDRSVTVKETYVDFLGKATTKDIQMRIKGKKGG